MILNIVIIQVFHLALCRCLLTLSSFIKSILKQLTYSAMFCDGFASFQLSCESARGPYAVQPNTRLLGLNPGQPPQQLTTAFYRRTTESILTGCITVWFGNLIVQDHRLLHKTLKTAAKITGMELPQLYNICTTCCKRKAQNIIKNTSHPTHVLF